MHAKALVAEYVHDAKRLANSHAIRAGQQDNVREEVQLLQTINNPLQCHHMSFMRDICHYITIIKVEFKNTPFAGKLSTTHRCTERFFACFL